MIKLQVEINGVLYANRTLTSFVEIDFCRGLRDGDKVTLRVDDGVNPIRTYEELKVIHSASTR